MCISIAQGLEYAVSLLTHFLTLSILIDSSNNIKTTPAKSLLFKNTRLSTCIITLQSRFISCGFLWWWVIRWMVVVGLADRNGAIITSLLISSSTRIITILLLLLVLWVKVKEEGLLLCALWISLNRAFSVLMIISQPRFRLFASPLADKPPPDTR